MNSYTLKVKGSDGTAIERFQLAFLTDSGAPIVVDGKPVVGEVTNGSYATSSEAAQLKYTISAEGYQDRTVTLVPGDSEVILVKKTVAQAAVTAASNNWKWILLAFVLLVLAWIGYKKFLAKKTATA